jgi:hypothetical protein
MAKKSGRSDRRMILARELIRAGTQILVALVALLASIYLAR